LEDPHSHFAAGGDCEVHMGESVMLRALPQQGTLNPAHILVTTRRTCPFDLGQWHCMGRALKPSTSSSRKPQWAPASL
jgi:hypothetical protein